VLNAASLSPEMAPGSMGLLRGSNLAGAAIRLGSLTLQQLSGSATEILFYLPATAPLGTAMLTVDAPSGAQAVVEVKLAVAAPGIFAGGIVQRGRSLEIYCTGLGVSGAPALVFIGATPVQPSYSGPAPGLTGINQVNVSLPAGIAPGVQPVVLSVASAHSNSVNITVQ
jgi:uncharacterized protein (TIGR03437 family)